MPFRVDGSVHYSTAKLTRDQGDFDMTQTFQSREFKKNRLLRYNICETWSDSGTAHEGLRNSNLP